MKEMPVIKPFLHYFIVMQCVPKHVHHK